VKHSEEEWQQGIRQALRFSGMQQPADTHAVSRQAILQGRRRVNARVFVKAAVVGMVVSSLMLVGVYVWADVEADRMTEALVSEDFLWML